MLGKGFVLKTEKKKQDRMIFHKGPHICNARIITRYVLF